LLIGGTNHDPGKGKEELGFLPAPLEPTKL